MKNNMLYALLMISLLSVWQADAEGTNTTEWGPLTNHIQMSVSLENGGREIKLNGTVILLVQFRNVSTNQIFQIVSMDTGRNYDPFFSFDVVSPSGKNVSPAMESSPTGSFRFIRILSGHNVEMEYELSSRCRFNEVGKYRIVARRSVDSMALRKSYLVVSNPFLLSVVTNRLNSN
jgi:hypothetical protein